MYFYLFSSGAFEFEFDHLVPNWQISFSATRILAKDGKVEGSKGRERRRRRGWRIRRREAEREEEGVDNDGEDDK